jgi:TRAP-type C4-dicarboxylate transport system substrate-binding protein
MLEQRSGGRVKIQMYWNESLVKTADEVRAVQEGIADIIVYWTTAMDPLNMFIRLPFMGWPSMEVANDIYSKVCDKFPELGKELEGMGVHLLWHSAMPGSMLNTTKKQVIVPADLNGMKIMGNADIYSAPFSSVGAAIVYKGPPDWYTSLDRGLVEGQIGHFPGIYTAKTMELFKYHTMFIGGGDINMALAFINVKKWNSLPNDIKQIIESIAPYEEAQTMAIDEGLITEATKWAYDNRHIFYYSTPAEMQQWFNLGKSVHDKWIADNTARGMPAQAIYDETLRLIKQASK